MTEESQRIAIAEACGWTEINQGGYGKPRPDCVPVQTPDYLYDLNAMHKAEKVLDVTQIGNYSDKLRNITGVVPQILGPTSFAWHATAAQRAEAFLRCIGKW